MAAGLTRPTKLRREISVIPALRIASDAAAVYSFPLLNCLMNARSQSSVLSASSLGSHSPDGSVRLTPTVLSLTRNLMSVEASSNSTLLAGANSSTMRWIRVR